MTRTKSPSNDPLHIFPNEIRDEIFYWAIVGDCKTMRCLGQVCVSWKEEAELAKERYYARALSRHDHSPAEPYVLHPVLGNHTYHVHNELVGQLRLITAGSGALEQYATHPPTRRLLFRLAHDNFEETLSDIPIANPTGVTLLDVMEQLESWLRASP